MATPDPYLPGHGDTRYRVHHYDLVLDYKVTTNHLKEVATLQLEVVAATETIELDLSGLQVGRVTLDGAPARFAHRGRKLVVQIGEREPGERLVLVVHVAGKPRPVRGVHGAAGWEELTDGVLVGSQPNGAPGWFPCNDDAADKATYRITLTLAKGYTAVCNGTLVAKASRAGTSTWTYQMDRPMSPYLATVQVGRYVVDARQGAPVPVEVVRPASLLAGPGTAFERQAEMVAHFAVLFGDYPFAEYRAVITDDALEIPLEAQGLSSFGRNFVPPTWDNERLVAHELAHQWFGNSVTASQLADIWLHEGFACYSEWLWSDHRSRDGLPTLQQQAATHHARLARSPQDLAIGAPGMPDMFDDRVYKRGALTLHAVHELLGSDRFWPMLQAWTSRHAGGVVSTEDFARHVQQFVPDRAAAVTSLLDAWLYGTKLPPLPVVL